MYEPQQLLDLQDNNGDFGGGADSRSWLSGEDRSPTLRRTDSSLSNSAAGNVDRMLFNDLVEIVPLVQSLIDRKAKSSFTRRGSMTYTKTPSKESLYKKTSEAKGRNAAQTTVTKKHRDQNKNVDGNQDGCTENFSMIFSRSPLLEKDREELMALREQVEDLQKKLSEKDELLREVEISKNEMASICAKLDEMKKEYAEKDSLLKSTQVQLSDAKVMLADKQAAVEKLEWEATTSSKKVDKLQNDLEVVRREIAWFMQFVQKLTKNGSRSLFKWEKEDKFHVVSSFEDSEGENCALRPPSTPPRLAVEKKKRRVKKTNKTKARLRMSTSSADDSGILSTTETWDNYNEEEDETETLVSSSRSFDFSTDDSSTDFNPQLETICETTTIRRRKKRNGNTKRRVKHSRRSFSSSKGRRSSVSTSSDSELPARLSVFQKLIPCSVDGKVKESFAIVKKSQDPYEDFKRSMMEMILEKQMFEKNELEQLLQCFLSLNGKHYHGLIVEAFSEIWETLFLGNGNGNDRARNMSTHPPPRTVSRTL